MAIGSHSIPKFYLEQFANPARRKGRPGKVWTYEKGKPTHPRSTDSQGYENGYFAFVKRNGTRDESFESKLAQLEARYSGALVCAKSRFCDLTSLAFKNELGFYVGLLFARSTSRKKFSAVNWAKMQAPFAQLEFDEEYVSDAAAHYSQATGELVTPEEIRKIIRDQAATFTQKEMTGNTFISDLLFHADILKIELVPRPWQVLIAPAETEFVTSDNPVVTFIRPREDVWHPGHGYRKPGVVVAFPLAPTACLTVGFGGREFQEVDAATVTRMNDIIIRCCDRFVYSKTFDNGIQAKVNAAAHTSVPGENAFIGQLPGTQQIQEHLRKSIGIQRRGASGGR